MFERNYRMLISNTRDNNWKQDKEMSGPQLPPSLPRYLSIDWRYAPIYYWCCYPKPGSINRAHSVASQRISNLTDLTNLGLELLRSKFTLIKCSWLKFIKTSSFPLISDILSFLYCEGSSTDLRFDQFRLDSKETGGGLGTGEVKWSQGVSLGLFMLGAATKEFGEALGFMWSKLIFDESWVDSTKKRFPSGEGDLGVKGCEFGGKRRRIGFRSILRLKIRDDLRVFEVSCSRGWDWEFMGVWWCKDEGIWSTETAVRLFSLGGGRWFVAALLGSSLSLETKGWRGLIWFGGG